MILSLLLDHYLLFHPDQQAQLENKLPAYTVGSLLEKIKVQSFLESIRNLLTDGNSLDRLQFLSDSIEQFFVPAPSKKHMAYRDMGRLESTPSLKYRARICSSYV